MKLLSTVLVGLSFLVTGLSNVVAPGNFHVSFVAISWLWVITGAVVLVEAFTGDILARFRRTRSSDV